MSIKLLLDRREESVSKNDTIFDGNLLKQLATQALEAHSLVGNGCSEISY